MMQNRLSDVISSNYVESGNISYDDCKVNFVCMGGGGAHLCMCYPRTPEMPGKYMHIHRLHHMV